MRNYIYDFLDFISKYFEVIIFCEGLEIYCAPVLDALEKGKKYFAHRIYGDHLLFENQHASVKYYNFLLGYGRSNKNAIIVDCDVAKYCLNMENGIPVTPMKDDGKDVELVYLAKYLEGIRRSVNIAEEIGKTIKECCPTMAI